MPFYGDIDAYCPPTPACPALRRGMAACAFCLVVIGIAVVL
jgi:hypothetical protein